MIQVCFWLLSGVHVTLESLIKDNDLQTTIKDLVRWSGRSLPKEDDSEVEVSPVSVLSSAEALSEKQKFASTTEKPVLVK